MENGRGEAVAEARPASLTPASGSDTELTAAPGAGAASSPVRSGDRFDRVMGGPRVGVHRVVARPSRFWAYLLAGFVSVVVLVGAAIISMNIFEIGLNAGQSGTTSTIGPRDKTPDAVLNPEAQIAVLNGTTTENLATGVGQVVTENNWGVIAFAGNAELNDVPISAVFYRSADDASAAAALAQKLGGVSIYVTDAYAEYGVQLIVLLGADYGGPGQEEAKALSAEQNSAVSESFEEGAPAE